LVEEDDNLGDCGLQQLLDGSTVHEEIAQLADYDRCQSSTTRNHTVIWEEPHRRPLRTHARYRFTAVLDFVQDYPGEPIPER